MAYSVQIKPSAAKDISKLPRNVQRRVGEALDGLATSPRPNGGVKLAGLADLYRVRVGDYRILYQIRDKELIILVVSVAHRKEAYR